MTNHWTFNEVKLIVADYFSMLVEEMKGFAVNKTHHRTALKALLNNRSDSSIEFKHQNISAVLIKLGLPFIKGYKPKRNYQQILEKAVIEKLIEGKHILEPEFVHFADSKVALAGGWDYSSIIADPPEPGMTFSEHETEYSGRPFKINYLEREQKNSDLGRKGELLVLSYEKWRLTQNGKDTLSDKVEWISKYDDGAGFDILSKNDDGTDRYIEVKTTKLTKYTPIFFTRNEYEFSKQNRKRFHLYRVFNFNERPKLFELKGSFDEFCHKEPETYSGKF